MKIGIVGLASACVLAKRGHDVTVFDLGAIRRSGGRWHHGARPAREVSDWMVGRLTETILPL